MAARQSALAALCIAVLTFGSTSGPVTAETPLICDRFFARDTLSQGEYDVFCDCQTITKPFVRAIQRDQNFADILKLTTQFCPGLSKFLSEVDTGSIGPGIDRGEGGGEPPGGEPGGEPGGGVDNGW